MQLNYDVIVLGMSVAFMVINVLRIRHKPFNCMPCMTAWCCLVVGVVDGGWIGVAYLPIGYFAGALFEVIKMRWL